MQEENKIEQLAGFLDIAVEEIEECYENKFKTSVGTYSVMTEDEVHEALEKSIINFVYDSDDISDIAENFLSKILNNYVGYDFLEEWISIDRKGYAEKIAKEFAAESSDDYANRLVEECIEAGIISEDDITKDMDYRGDMNLEDEFAQYLMEEIIESHDSADYDLAKYIKREISPKVLYDMMWKEGVLDMDDISDTCEMSDAGKCLADYDGVTEVTGDFFVFRQSDTDDRSKDFLNELSKNRDTIERN